MVQMKFTAAALIAAAAIAPTLAAPYAEDSLAAREIEEYSELIARAYELDLEEREFDEELETREFDEFDLEAREPFLGMNHAGRWLKKKFSHGGQQQQQQYDQQEAREFDEELDARDFDEELDARDFEEFDLEAREPFLGLNHAGRWLKKKFSHGGQQQQQYDQQEAREFDEELDARDFDEELEARDFDEFDLEAREPILGMKTAGKWISKKFRSGGPHHGGQGGPHHGEGRFSQGPHHGEGGHHHHQQQQQLEQQSQPEGREYDELLTRHFDEIYERELGLMSDAEITERDYDDEFELMQREYDELISREPGVIDWFKNLFKSKKQKAEEKKKAAEKKKAEEEKKQAEASKKAEAEEPAAAATEAREYYDFYDELD